MIASIHELLKLFQVVNFNRFALVNFNRFKVVNFIGFCSVSQNIVKLKGESSERVKDLYNSFKELPEYSVQSLKEGLSAREKVVDRLSASSRCFNQ